MNSVTPIPADSEQLTVVVRLETAKGLEKLAAAKGFPSPEDLLAEVARIIAGRHELSPSDLREIADRLERRAPVRQPKKPDPETRGTVARLIGVLRFLVTGEHNCTSIARDLECSIKTVQRDLDFIRDRLGVTVDFQPSKNTYQVDGVDFDSAVENVAALGLLGGLGAEVAK